MSELRLFETECNFTESELQLFKLRSKDIPLEQCAEKMNISTSCVKRLSRKVKSKIDRVKGQV